MSPAEVLAIRAEVRAFAEKVVAPRARAIGDAEESVEHFPWDVFHAMGEAGLFRIPFPAEVGGRGLKHPAAATAVVIEQLSYYSSSVGAIYDVQDRKSVVSGKSVSVRVDLGGRRILNKKKKPSTSEY